MSGGFGEKSVFLNFIHSGRLDTWGQRFGKGMWREIQRIKEGKMRAAGNATGTMTAARAAIAISSAHAVGCGPG